MFFSIIRSTESGLNCFQKFVLGLKKTVSATFEAAGVENWSKKVGFKLFSKICFRTQEDR